MDQNTSAFKTGDQPRSKRGLIVLLIPGLLLGLTLAIFYYFSYDGIRKDVKQRAESELRETSLKIKSIMSVVEVAANNISWAVEGDLRNADDMYLILEKLVSDNKNIIGAGIGFVENYYPQKGRWFEPYVVRNINNRMECKQVGSAQHDYLKMDWFTSTITSDSCRWSEPYFDDSGAGTLVATYTHPLHDKTGRVVAVLGADVSLDWLSHIINDDHGYPSENIVLSRQGQIMACPVESLVMRKNALEVSDKMNDTMATEVNRRMIAGEKGELTVHNDLGEKTYVYFAPIDDTTGWSMAIICKDKEIYRSLRTVGFNLMLLMLFGLALLGYILWRAARQLKRIQTIHTEKERIASELRIASGIQNSMIPKTFPPYPDRDDVEIFGVLEPAKEVGGDLYDFFIRDEKLFFCISDVSGKGVPSSLVMVVVRVLFRTLTTHESNPSKIVAHINEALSDENNSNMFVTLFVGVLDLPTGRLRYCNAGHCAPILIGTGIGQLPVIANIPAGIDHNYKYEGQETQIDPDTTIFLYTDGLTEAEDTEHNLFMEHRVMTVVTRCHEQHQNQPQTIIDEMERTVKSFVGSAERSDDLTMMAIQYHKEQHDVKLQRSLSLPNDIETVPQLNVFIDGVAEEIGLDTTLTMSLNLAIEEAVVNVMNYAYPSGKQGDVNVDVTADSEWLTFVISDKGMPFDPTAKEEADTTLSVEERPIGGLGIFLVRQLMDSINYERTDGKNVLTLKKKLK